MTPAFSERRLEWLVRSRGTDLTVWPEADRVATMDLLRRSPEAQSVFADALASEDDAVGTEANECAVLERMQAVLRRRLAPLPMVWRCVCAGALVACMATGLYLAVDHADPDITDLFSTAQTVSVAALDQ
ncbi:MAG: hypothetical protein ACRYF2_10970 [Janthinobacterium lividum]